MTARNIALLCAAAALAILLAIQGPRWVARAWTGTGFAARLACSCHYVEGRGWEGCGDDLADEPVLTLVALENDPARRTVTASLPLFATRSARFEPGFGCLMVPD